ncbi:hypothetical protein QZN11_26855 [Streptomyces gramineus]|uniref:hypothetical protein n=1 Tax=Streptomyces gramineus TaxID=910542 RepID=UPI00398A7EAF
MSAAEQHGEAETARFAFAVGGTLAVLGVAARTPDSALRALLWLVDTAAVYTVCPRCGAAAAAWSASRARSA